jgi:hypothetical protein
MMIPITKGEKSGEPSLAEINHEIANVLQRWLFEKAQSELQQNIASQGSVSCEAFANVASLLCSEEEFAPLGFLVLQQGLRFGQATFATDCIGYALLLRDMGTCLSKQGRHHQALGHYLAARGVFERADSLWSPDYAGLLTLISENAMAAASARVEVEHTSPTSAPCPADLPGKPDEVAGALQMSVGVGLPVQTHPQHQMQDVSVLQEPLNDLKTALVCIPSCQYDTTLEEEDMVDSSQKDKLVMLKRVLPESTPAFSTPTKEPLLRKSGNWRDNEPMEFGELMNERAQITANRRHLRDREFLEPEQPADAGLFSMLSQWASKVGFCRPECHGEGSSLLQGCRSSATNLDEEWI